MKKNTKENDQQSKMGNRKRKRNQAMLDKLKGQIDHFDSKKKVVEGTSTTRITKKMNVSKNVKINKFKLFYINLIWYKKESEKIK